MESGRLKLFREKSGPGLCREERRGRVLKNRIRPVKVDEMRHYGMNSLCFFKSPVKMQRAKLHKGRQRKRRQGFD